MSRLILIQRTAFRLTISIFRRCRVVTRLMSRLLSVFFDMWVSKARQLAVERVKCERAEGKRRTIAARVEAICLEVWKAHAIECRRVAHIQAKVMIRTRMSHSSCSGRPLGGVSALLSSYHMILFLLSSYHIVLASI